MQQPERSEILFSDPTAVKVDLAASGGFVRGSGSGTGQLGRQRRCAGR